MNAKEETLLEALRAGRRLTVVEAQELLPHCSQTGISAGFRNLRKAAYGSWPVKGEWNQTTGQFEYFLTNPQHTPPFQFDLFQENALEG